MPPAYTEKQRKFMAAALGRKEAGRMAKGDPKMSEQQLRDFARKPKRKTSR